MATDRIVFIPFNRSQATDFIDETKRADQHGKSGRAHHDRRFTVVCYDDPGEPLKDLGFSFGTRVLIAGHGVAGRPYVSNSSGVGQKQYLPFNVVGARLIAKGLPKRYTGAIGCDVCYSAIDSDTNPCFADLLARYMYHKGYKLMHTIGYMGPLGAVHEKLTGDHKFFHRVVDIENEQGQVEKTIKSSSWSAKRRFSGIWSIPKHLDGLAVGNDTCPAY